MPNTLYIVAGMHRSGTSLVARMLEVYGIALPGELIGPAADNEKGFFEDREIIELNDELMSRLDIRWDSLSGFFLEKSDFSSPKFNHLKGRARKLLESRVALDSDWAFKDPRVSRLLGFWLPLIDSLKIPVKFVLPVRNPVDVAASLDARDGFHPVKSAYLWLLHNLDALVAVKERDYIIVQYEALLEAPDAVINSFPDFFPAVNRKAADEFTGSFVSGDLQHNHSSVTSTSVVAADTLYSSLQAADIDYALVQKLAEDIQQQDELNQLLELLTRQELGASTELAAQHKELADLVQLRDEQIEEYRRYQGELTHSLESQKAWSDKQAADIEALKGNIEEQRSVNASLNEDIGRTRLELQDAQSALANATEQIHGIQQAADDESRRLWEIIETYRLRIEEMENSHSWLITSPLRWLRRSVSQAPGVLYRGAKGLVRSVIFSLPPDNRVRVGVITFYERLHLMLNGEVDNRSVRLAHQAVISGRSELLGSKPVLEVAALPDIDIGVVTYNSEKWVSQFVDSLASQDYPLSKIHLVFVDNGSTDDTAASLRDIDGGPFASIKVIESTNTGYGDGHNRAAEEGLSELMLVTNIDLEFRSDSLVRAVSFAAQDDDDVVSWELRQAPFEHPKFYDPVTLQTSWSSHACVLFRRSAFKTVGGYEPKIFMYGEDVELSYRFRAGGFRIRYLPFAVVDHYTYETEGEVKPMQYQGSLLANAYLRMRYGSVVDVLRIFRMYARLLLGRGGVPEHRPLVRQNIASILTNAVYFLRSRSGSQEFAFRGWDYDIARDGAFYTQKPLPDDLPLVSVITRTYKGREQLLKQCVQSVAHQTYPNIEHLIVEDGGESMSPYIEEIRKSYPDMSIRHLPQEKVGRCVAGNAGMEAASGEYVVFLDDDDLFFSDHIEVCMSRLLSEPELGGAYALAWEIETEFNEQGYEERSHATADILRQDFDFETLLDHNYIPIQSIVFRRKLYETYGGFDADLENLEDWNLWIRYAKAMPFAFIEKTTSMYRTPWDIEERMTRQAVLDSYLEVAQEKNRLVVNE